MICELFTLIDCLDYGLCEIERPARHAVAGSQREPQTPRVRQDRGAAHAVSVELLALHVPRLLRNRFLYKI
jgi:hypothetical protein